MAKVTRIDHAGSFSTTFKFEDGNNGSEIWVPVDQADDYETSIVAASWASLLTLFNLSDERVIKTNE